MFEHPQGYAELRYLPNKRPAAALAALLTQLGRLLLRRGWSRFLADNRQMTPFNSAEKEWFVTHWLGHQVERPAPLLGIIILPAEVIARLAVMELVAQAPTSSLRYLTYTDPSAAHDYLAQPPTAF